MAADADESKFAFLSQLWPNTLCKFWGLHAAAWGAAAAALVLLSRSALPLPLVGANVVLAALLYRSQEDAGTALAALAGVYFSFHAAMLWLGPAAFMTMRNQPVRLWLRCAQLWHTVLALGGFIFSLKAALKDRLFSNQDGSMKSFADGGGSGVSLPTLAMINSKAGAKIGDVVQESLDKASEDAKASNRVLEVVDLATTTPVDALKAFSNKHKAFRVLVCGGDGSASWVLGAIEESGTRARERESTHTPPAHAPHSHAHTYISLSSQASPDGTANLTSPPSLYSHSAPATTSHASSVGARACGSTRYARASPRSIARR